VGVVVRTGQSRGAEVTLRRGDDTKRDDSQ
jgi:hypothetical protein